MSEESLPVKEYHVKSETAFHFKILAENEKVVVQLKSGHGEMFGKELVVNEPYEFFTGAQAAIFTFRGCTLIVKGNIELKIKKTPMYQYLNYEAALERRRNNAQKYWSQGPIVTMVFGPPSAGKTTLCRFLLNYAVQQGRNPIFVDLDVGEGSVSIPGSIGAFVVKSQASIEEIFSRKDRVGYKNKTQNENNPGAANQICSNWRLKLNDFIFSLFIAHQNIQKQGKGLSQKSRIVYHFGHISPSKNHGLYNIIVSELAEKTFDFLKRNSKPKNSEIVINTCGGTNDIGCVLDSANAFQVDIIYVHGNYQRSFYDKLRRGRSPFEVIELPNCEGLARRTPADRAQARNVRIREYFYGELPVSPQSTDVQWSDVKIYMIDPGPIPSCNCLVCMKLVKMEPGPELLNHIFAISFAESAEKVDDVLQADVVGFLCVTGVNVERQTLTVSSPPQSIPFANHILLFSDLKFIDRR